MQVENKTKYDTRYLKRLFIACDKHEGAHITSKRMRGRKVWVKPGRSRIHGAAWLHSTSIVMSLPAKEPSARKIAQIYIHELGHNLGLNHKHMMNWWEIDVSWWPDECVPLKAKKITAVEKPNIVEVRAAKAQKKLDEWTKKLNRAKTFVKKYRTKVRYYERRAAAKTEKGD
jgi:hypothetical protein